MTQLEVLFRYERHPSETAMFALGKMRDVYGVRRIQIDQGARSIRVEYDATRLNKAIVWTLLRGTGIDLVEEVPLVLPPPPQAEPAAASAAPTK